MIDCNPTDEEEAAFLHAIDRFERRHGLRFLKALSGEVEDVFQQDYRIMRYAQHHPRVCCANLAGELIHFGGRRQHYALSAGTHDG